VHYNNGFVQKQHFFSTSLSFSKKEILGKEKERKESEWFFDRTFS
jgi:hypothetical protein